MADNSGQSFLQVGVFSTSPSSILFQVASDGPLVHQTPMLHPYLRRWMVVKHGQSFPISSHDTALIKDEVDGVTLQEYWCSHGTILLANCSGLSRRCRFCRGY